MGCFIHFLAVCLGGFCFGWGLFVLGEEGGLLFLFCYWYLPLPGQVFQMGSGSIFCHGF